MYPYCDITALSGKYSLALPLLWLKLGQNRPVLPDIARLRHPRVGPCPCLALNGQKQAKGAPKQADFGRYSPFKGLLGRPGPLALWSP